jgi:hypothetical protein
VRSKLRLGKPAKFRLERSAGRRLPRRSVPREGGLKLSFRDALRASTWQAIYSLLDLLGRNGLTVRR